MMQLLVSHDSVANSEAVHRGVPPYSALNYSVKKSSSADRILIWSAEQSRGNGRHFWESRGGGEIMISFRFQEVEICKNFWWVCLMKVDESTQLCLVAFLHVSCKIFHSYSMLDISLIFHVKYFPQKVYKKFHSYFTQLIFLIFKVKHFPNIPC